MTTIDDAILSEPFLNEVRTLLIRARSALIELDRTSEDRDPSNVEALQEVDAALARLDDGSFGSCTGCSSRLPAERIEIMPAAALCVRCQHELEVRAF